MDSVILLHYSTNNYYLQKEMKKYIASFIVAFACMTANADNYKILFANTKTVNIGGKTLAVGDTFDDQQKISWSNNSQAIKVQNVTTKKVKVLTAAQMKSSGSIMDFYTKTNHLSTRGSDDYDQLDNMLDDDLYILDEVRAKSWLKVDDSNYFILKFVSKGKEKSLRLAVEDDFVVFKRKDLASKGSKTGIQDASLWYHSENGSEKKVHDSWNINFIKLKVK